MLLIELFINFLLELVSIQNRILIPYQVSAENKPLSNENFWLLLNIPKKLLIIHKHILQLFTEKILLAAAKN